MLTMKYRLGLLATCKRLAVKKLSQAMQTHPNIGLLIASVLSYSKTGEKLECFLHGIIT